MFESNSKTKRRLGLVVTGVAVLLLTALFILWYFPALTFRIASISDGPNNWSQEWKTILFIRVSETMHHYPSREDARQAFQTRIAGAETILEHTKQPVGRPDVDEQVIGTFINSLSERRYSIIRLQGTNVYQTYAPSLRYALALDNFHGRMR